MKIEKDKIVGIHYELTDPSGQKIDSSAGMEPLYFIFGSGAIIPGLEAELEGKTTGDKLTAVIPPEKAYGPREDEMVQEIPKAQFETEEEIVVGMQYQVETEIGGLIVTVTEVKDESIVVDGNHPLAGVTLHFDVSVEGVRDATKEELEQGHVQGS